MSLDGVASTAVATARIRAGESRRADRLFDDPLAVEIARSTGVESGAGDLSTHPLRKYLRLQVVVRTAFYDEFVRAAVGAGCRQVVLVASGYDARAFRLSLPPDVTVFELDQPSVLDAKAAAIRQLDLRPTTARIALPVDLRNDDWPAALTAAGHHRSAPTAWLLEGLLVYLNADATDQLLTAITEASSAGSRLACEQTSPRQLPARTEHDDHGVAATRWWLGGPDRPVDSWLGDHGWTCRCVSVSDVAARYGRAVPADVRETAESHGFVTAARQE